MSFETKNTKKSICVSLVILWLRGVLSSVLQKLECLLTVIHSNLEVTKVVVSDVLAVYIALPTDLLQKVLQTHFF